MTAYYNEFDSKKAAWLRELMQRGLITSGVVDERSIHNVQPDDLREFTQCHFFAGIGVWSYALRNAGWSDDTPVWTGSCPCQPFSSAGKQEGFEDPRHLWPEWYRLIKKCKPGVIFGEQSDKALTWLDLVSGELETEEYAIGSAIVGAHSVGAPHIRQRIYFVAESDREQLRAEGSRKAIRTARDAEAETRQRQRLRIDAGECGAVSKLGHTEGSIGRLPILAGRSFESGAQSIGTSEAIVMANAGCEDGARRRVLRSERPDSSQGTRKLADPGIGSTTSNAWANAEWIPCRDGKSRPVEPCSFPLAYGASERVVRLRGYGDAIVAPLAQAFIESYLEIGSEQ